MFGRSELIMKSESKVTYTLSSHIRVLISFWEAIEPQDLTI